MSFLIMSDNKRVIHTYVMAHTCVYVGLCIRLRRATRTHVSFHTAARAFFHVFYLQQPDEEDVFPSFVFLLILSLTKLRICRIIQTFVALNQIKCKI